MNLKWCEWKLHSCEAIIFCVEGYRRITRHIRIPDLFLVQLGLSNSRQYLRKSWFLEQLNYCDSLEPTNFPQGFFFNIFCFLRFQSSSLPNIMAAGSIVQEEIWQVKLLAGFLSSATHVPEWRLGMGRDLFHIRSSL